MSRVLRRPALLAAALAGLLCVAPGRVAAQVVRGQVVEDVTATPVQGAMVVLLELDGTPIRRVLTDATGAFIVQATHPGAHLIRVDRIGYESVTTPRFDVPLDGIFQRITVPIRPVELAGLEVEGSRRCRLRADQGPATARAWEEARKALEAAAWTLSSGAYRYTLLHVERTLDRDARTVLREDRRFARSSGQAPYVSAPVAELMEEGFIRLNSDRSLTYFAPDAEAFLSDAFLDTHCMALASVKDGLVGLEFEPVRGRNVPDIRGTLWIEAATSTLRRLDFTYVNVPEIREATGAGGEVVFGRLPNGMWIVREWSIRMPFITTNPARSRTSVTGYQVHGGVVWRVVDSEGNVVVEAATASLSGSVTDSLGAAPIPPARVHIREGGEGGPREVPTRPDGSFSFHGLPPGIQWMEVFHPSLDSLGLGSVPAQVAAEAGTVESVRVRIPGVLEILDRACSGGEAPPEGTAVVLGRVTRLGAPAAGARVRIRWLGDVRRSFDASTLAAPPVPGSADLLWREDGSARGWVETTLDERGIFMLCGVPAPSQLRVEAGDGDDQRAGVFTLPANATTFLLSLVLPEPREP